MRTLTFDLRYSPIAQGDAVAIVGESTTSELPGELYWLPLTPPANLEVSLLARRHNRSAAVDRMLDAAAAIADELGWI